MHFLVYRTIMHGLDGNYQNLIGNAANGAISLHLLTIPFNILWLTQPNAVCFWNPHLSATLFITHLQSAQITRSKQSVQITIPGFPPKNFLRITIYKTSLFFLSLLFSFAFRANMSQMSTDTTKVCTHAWIDFSCFVSVSVHWSVSPHPFCEWTCEYVYGCAIL